MKDFLTVGVVGAGDISDIYLTNMIHRFSNLSVKSITSRGMSHAKQKAEKYGICPVSLEEMLADPEIDLIVNLTPAYAHYNIIKSALLAGKHVYTEKTFTDKLETARELLSLADEKGLYLGSAPDTFLGAALQTARDCIERGMLGTVTSCAAVVNRDSEQLMSFYDFLREPGGGACYDYGVYYITALTSLIGPVARVAAFVEAPYKTHINNNPESPLFGQVMDTPNESEVSAILKFKSGITGTFHMNWNSIMPDQGYMAILGTKGILYLPDPDHFGGEVRFLANTARGAERELITVVPHTHPYADNSRGIGPSDLADAVLHGRKPRANKEFAFHVMEVLDSMMISGETGEFVTITSTCDRPEPRKKEEM